MGFDELMFSGGSGLRHSTRASRRPARNKKSEKTIPALAFVFPYHEMLLRGLLNVDGFGVKTRSSNWNYRGPVLLYTSKGRPHDVPVKAYGLNPDNYRDRCGVIVGIATIVNSRLLTAKERIQIVKNFNNVGHDAVVSMILGTYDKDYVEPLPFGVFLKNIKRFEKPVPFTPRRGAIGIMRVPLRQVSKTLKVIGINPKDIK